MLSRWFRMTLSVALFLGARNALIAAPEVAPASKSTPRATEKKAVEKKPAAKKDAAEVKPPPPALPAAVVSPGRVEFTRLVAHWTDYGKPEYLKFLDEAQPDIAQVGFYGGHFYSLAHTKYFNGYPAHFPVQGMKECGNFFQNLNAEIHRRNIKVIGHINVSMMFGNPRGTKGGPEGFFKYYEELWDEKELGLKPVANPLDLIEKHADGSPNFTEMYSAGNGGMKEYWACLANPYWRTVLKAWTKRGIERGVDGYMINYFYRHDCMCPHCQAKFRGYLKNRFTPVELKDKFAIPDVEHHKFTEIVGWHDPKTSTPLRRVMLEFSQATTKEAFDEVFIEYGRKLKPDLIVGQWNHLGDFHQISGDERSLLPPKLWGRGEDYLWYSTGGSACYTDLKAGFLGDGTLQARYIRGAFDDKPFTLGKYESTRIRAAISELAANGGAPMGFYTNFTDPAAREVIVRYYRFIKRYEELYRASRSVSDVLLLYPRTAVHAGNMSALDGFRDLGRALLDQHVLFDVLPDDLASEAERRKYAAVLTWKDNVELKPEVVKVSSTFVAPQTVRVSVSRPAGEGNELDVHFVNYNREEPKEKKSPGRGIVDEKPIAVRGIKASVRVPSGYRVSRIEAITPEGTGPEPLKFDAAPGSVRFTMPEFLVYGVARLRLEPIQKP